MAAKALSYALARRFFTQNIFQSHIAFLTKQYGSKFIGKPMVEAVKTIIISRTSKSRQYISKTAVPQECMNLGKRLKNDKHELHQNPKITAVHASHIDRSKRALLLITWLCWMACLI